MIPLMRKWILRAVIPAVVILSVLWWTCARPDPVPVRVEAVSRANVEATVTNSKAGTIRARRRARLTAEVGGRVIEITHREGDHVEKGELLVRLNDESARAQHELAIQSLAVAKANKSQACISKDRAYRDWQRKQKLADKNIVSEDVLDQLRSTYRAADSTCNAAAAEIEKAAASITAAEADLSKHRILAPFAGIIAEQDVELGEWVTPSPPLLTSPAVVDIIDPSSVYLSAPMDEVDSTKIVKGQEAKVTIDSYPSKEFQGNVVRVAPYVVDVEAQNRTVEVEVELVDKAFAAKLLPGTSADAEIVLETRNSVLRVPTTALLENRKVLVFDGSELEERTVEVGLRNWDYVEILSGVEEGEEVVVTLDRVEVKTGVRAELEEDETE